MSSFFILSSMVSVLLGLAVLEYRRHQNRILAIPHRIHVNGTRGKSSVTRLIGAGLRAGGIKTLTKVTGSFPRLILADGSDVPVHRKAAPSILEQLDIVRFAHRQGVEALVIECMALYPENQRITEHQMIHATVPVLVNVRLDHTDIMGRTLAEVGATMAHTFPSGSRVLTAESDHLDLVQRLGRERGAWIEPVSVDEAQPEDLAGFRYLEHRENVALALAVCRRLGVERQVALRGMWEAKPDAGVLTRARVAEGDAVCTFFNAFAANDAESSLLIWRKLEADDHLQGKRFILLNSRADRKERSEQLSHLVAVHLADAVDTVFVMGEPTDAVVRRLRGHGLPEERIVDLGPAQPADVFAAVMERSMGESSVVGIGNMGGFGAATVEYFEQRSRQSHG